MNALAPIVADDRANPGEPRSALGAGRRRGRVLEAAARRVDRRLAAAAGDAQGDLRAGRRARHAPREVVRALDRLAVQGGDAVAGPHPSGMLTLTATPMPQSLPRPMLASLDEAPLADPRFAYEPKYDGIRALAMVRAGGGPGAVRLWSRLGNDKTSQFPEIARALAVFARKLKADVLLDGEIVALDQHGEPAGFQRLQGRIHLTSERDIGGREGTEPVAFVAFDVLRDGHTDLTALPLTARRARLERIFGNTGTTRLRLSDFRPGDGRTLYRDVLARGWEGLVAKELDSPYQSGRRSGAWRKIKVVRRQECVVGGWTEGRGSRAHFGALLLGVWEGGALVHIGHTGTGFNERELARVAALLRPLETTTCPFATRPVANERPHWTRPEIVVEVGFTEWTADVMRRLPDGVRGKAFYQQRAPADTPPGVRVDTLPVDTEVPSRLIGGSLMTLLYMAQIAAISQDPWFSRVGSLDDADHVVLDLDPMPGVPFATVVDVARWIHDELARVGTPSVPKTSGASGMHVYIPLPPRTSYETGRIFCEIVATLVAERHPRAATLERAVDARGRRVYVDYMQNFRGKTLATAYSARASDFAGASTPLTWREVHAGVDHRDFTLTTLPERVRRVGDLWAALGESPGADLSAILDRSGRRRPPRAKKRA